MIAKDLNLADVCLSEFQTTKYALRHDMRMRTTDDDQLHGSDTRIENASGGATAQITWTAAGVLSIDLYVIMDDQLQIESGRFVSAIY